jgi:hypothetical protein
MKLLVSVCAIWFVALPVRAQQGKLRCSGSDPAFQTHRCSQKHDHSKMGMAHHGSAGAQHARSGTAEEPQSTPSSMLMTSRRGWALMFHGNVFIVEAQQSGPRGGDKFFSTNWFMAMAEHPAGGGTFAVRLMQSLEPLTVSDRRYPLLFQQGETAFGRAIVDGQHPHDFFMELAAQYDKKLGEHGGFSLYLAPVGDPAIGPTAYSHRASAAENPVAPLGHHQQDSTHISSDVITAGAVYRWLRMEASGFHGREPDESRWNIDQGSIDSWATRLTISPARNWTGQISYARIASIEALFPNEDQARTTASIMYNRPLAKGNWASTLLWGRTRSLEDQAVFSSYLFESTLRFGRNALWTRIENTDRSSELLLDPHSPPAGQERPIGRVQAFTFGYDREFGRIPYVSTAVGAQLTTYGVPAVLEVHYGRHPLSGIVFLRLRPRMR